LNKQTARRTAVIVAEYPIWLDAFQLLLERLGVEVAGRAVREEEAIRLLEEHRPDMFLADFPAITDDVGSPLLARARAANPEVRCIVLSERDEPAEMERAFGAGALIFCARRTDPDDLAAAIRQSFDRSIYFATGPRGPRPRVATPDASDDPLAALTRREVEILRLAAEGFSNAQIAKSL